MRNGLISLGLMVLALAGCEKHDPHNFYGTTATRALVGQKIVSVDPDTSETLTIRLENGAVFQIKSSGCDGLKEPVYQPAN